MKPYVITFDGDFLATQTLRHDGEGLVKDSREAMRFETDLDAEIYIENNREKLDKIGKNPTPIWSGGTQSADESMTIIGSADRLQRLHRLHL